MTNTNLQHYAGETALSNFTQVVFILPNMFLSASVGFCALAAIIRAFRGEASVGNFFVDMWRVCMYVYVPAALVFGVIFMQQGMPMTFASTEVATTLERARWASTTRAWPSRRRLSSGRSRPSIPIKMLGTNGGGFYGMNSAHPLENPTATSNFFTMLAMMIFPFALVLMYGRMLGRIRHSVRHLRRHARHDDRAHRLGHPHRHDGAQSGPDRPRAAAWQVPSASAPNGRLDVAAPAVAALPVDQHLGNLEGKELRFGTSAGAAFAAITTDVTCGAINAEMDSLNPLAGISPMIGMWLNCVFGGKGVGMINLLLFLIVGVFLAGQMVGRTPEYLGRKVGAREMKLAMIALLVHPILILGPSGLFAATGWGTAAEANPGAHGFSEIVYQYSSASANNGSAMDGLGVTYGLNANPKPSPEAVPWDIGTGLVMLFSRYLPIIAPIAMAWSLGRKKVAPVTLGTMSDDTLTFGFLLFGTIAVVGALLLPAGRGAWADRRAPRADPVRRRLTVKGPFASRPHPSRSSIPMNTAVDQAPPEVPPRSTFSGAATCSRPTIVTTALKQSVVMLRPDVQWKNPVMFVVEIGAVLTLFYVVQAAFGFSSSAVSLGYFVALDIWLWLTVLFANFATAIAEERGKAQAETLRKTRVATPAYRLRADGTTEAVSSVALKVGDVVVVEARQVIPGDGDVIEGGAVVNEAAITGESAPVIREAGGDRSGVTGGTTVLSDRIVVRISAGAGKSFLDKMIALVEGARRQRTPNEIALTLVLTAFTLIFMIVVVPLWPMAFNAETYMTSYLGLSDPLRSLGTDVPTLIALIVCLIPTTIGALLAAIGIAGMDRALRANIIAKSGKAVEVAGDIDTVLLDKTGTITIGDRQAREFVALDGYQESELLCLAALASVSDQTPEGRSIVAAYAETLRMTTPVAAPLARCSRPSRRSRA